MNKMTGSAYFYALLSGVLMAVSTLLMEHTPQLIWVALIPLFGELFSAKPKKAFKLGLVYGGTVSCILCSWMIMEAGNYSGGGVIYGVLAFVLSTLFLAVMLAIPTTLFSLLGSKLDGVKAGVLNSFLLAVLFCLSEGVISLLNGGFPWLGYHASLPLLSDLYAIQIASSMGVYGISFIILLVNGLLAFGIKSKTWLLLTLPACLLLVFYGAGFLTVHSMKGIPKEKAAVRIALLSDNLPPTTKWDDQTGNMMVGRLRAMNQRAAQLKPNIALWPETVVPWTYEKTDDFVNLIIGEAAYSGLYQLIGMSTATGEKGVVYNSAYFIAPDSTVQGRYDKQRLLNLIEQYYKGFLIPFRSSLGFSLLPGPEKLPINTPYGKAGVMICNESTSSAAALNNVENGAEFLLNMSNDGWYSNSYLAPLHFYQARLRAVESRKDMAVSSTNGYSGLILSTGEILLKKRSTDPIVELVTLYPNSVRSSYSRHPFSWVYGCLVILLGCIVGGSFLKSKTNG